MPVFRWIPPMVGKLCRPCDWSRIWPRQGAAESLFIFIISGTTHVPRRKGSGCSIGLQGPVVS